MIAVAFGALPDGSNTRDPNSFWERAIYSASHALMDSRVATVLVPSLNHSCLAALPVDAILIVSNDVTEPITPISTHSTTPLIVAGRDEHDPDAAFVTSWISPGNDDLLASAMDHLIEHGATRPAFISTPQPLAPIDALTAAAIQWFERNNLEAIIEHSSDTTASTTRALKRGADAILLLGDESRPDLDGVINATSTAHLRVPDDVLVMSVSEGGRAQYLTPPVTSIAWNGQAVGAAVADMIATGLKTGQFESISLPHLITPRESTNRMR